MFLGKKGILEAYSLICTGKYEANSINENWSTYWDTEALKINPDKEFYFFGFPF